MGTFAIAVQSYLRDVLADRRRSYDWETEYAIAGTPVDIAGVTSGELAVVELEWRRADPANNTAKLFRHLAEGALDAEQIVVFQIFTGYYDLVRGGVSSKRANAEFVGRVAAETLDSLAYHPIEFELDPPKRGADRPEGWKAVADATARRIAARL